MFRNASSFKIFKKKFKFFFDFDKLRNTLVFRYFLAAAPGSGGKQLLAISIHNSDSYLA
jgi:hypothetical protein